MTIHDFSLGAATRPSTLTDAAVSSATRRPAIEIRGVTKRFGSHLAVDDVTLDFRPGRVSALLGPNGSGKSTLLSMILGFLLPSAGDVLVAGDRPTPAVVHRRVGFVAGSGFHPGRTARASLEIDCGAGGTDRRRVDDLLAAVELTGDADRRVGTFSLGMKQRLSVARALLRDPEILILDEPGNGLDPPGMAWLRGVLRNHADGGGTVLLASHHLLEVSQLADDVAILAGGRCIAAAPIGELEAAAAQPAVYVSLTEAAALAAHLATIRGVRTEAVADHRLRIDGLSAEQVSIAAARIGVPIAELIVVQPTLEEVFFRIIDQQSGE